MHLLAEVGGHLRATLRVTLHVGQVFDLPTRVEDPRHFAPLPSRAQSLRHEKDIGQHTRGGDVATRARATDD